MKNTILIIAISILGVFLISEIYDYNLKKEEMLKDFSEYHYITTCYGAVNGFVGKRVIINPSQENVPHL